MQGTHGNAQLLYELTFCIWTLSFHEQVRPTPLPLSVQTSPVPFLFEDLLTSFPKKGYRALFPNSFCRDCV
jgi:hypothetical protein